MRTMLTTFALAALLAAGTLAAAQDTPRLVVRGADGGLVGVGAPLGSEVFPDVDFARSPLWVVRPVPQGWIQILVSRDAVWGTRTHVPFLYENVDCSGPALLESPSTSDEPRVALVFDSLVYWPVSVGTSHVIRSLGVPVAELAQCEGALIGAQLCCTALHEEQQRVAAEVTGCVLTELGLRLPFRLEQAMGVADAVRPEN